MVRRASFSVELGGGVLSGALLFFLCYWWLGTITASAVIALLVAASITVLGRFNRGASR